MVETAADRVLRLDRRQEVGRDELGTLVDELVERVRACRRNADGSVTAHDFERRIGSPFVPDCPQMIGPVW